MKSKSKYLHFRVSAEEHRDLKQRCDGNDLTISRFLKTLTTLALNDYELEQRVLNEAKRQ